MTRVGGVVLLLACLFDGVAGLELVQSLLRGRRGGAALGGAEAAELFEAVVGRWSSSSSAAKTAVDEDRLGVLMDALAAKRVPFAPSQLDGGLWLSLHTRGPTPRWARNAKLVPGMKNRAGQDYSSEGRTVRNYGEVLGPALAFEALGRFDLPRCSSKRRCPVEVPVEIESGRLLVGFLTIDLPMVRGPGLVRVDYVDDNLRIFTSPTDSPDDWERAGVSVVQVREAALIIYPEGAILNHS